MNGKLRLKEGIGFGLVKIGTDREDHKKAVKILNKTRIVNRQKLDYGSKIMINLRHPNVVPLEEVIETESKLYFVMELMNVGSLASHIGIEAFDISLTHHFFCQIVQALNYCNEHGINHGNLKLENIYLCPNGITIKVGGFGYNGALKDHSFNDSKHLAHLAPEQIRKDESLSTEKADVWALGVLLYRMLLKKHPFYSESPQETVKLITHGEVSDIINGDLKTKGLLSMLLKYDPAERPSLKAILEHPWLKASVESNDPPQSLLNVSFTVKCIYIKKDAFEQVFKAMLHADGFLFQTMARKEADGTILTLECSHKEWMKFRAVIHMSDVNHIAGTEPASTPKIPTDPSIPPLHESLLTVISPQNTTDSSDPQVVDQPITQPNEDKMSEQATVDPKPVSPEICHNSAHDKDESEYISIETVVDISFEYISGDGSKFRKLCLETKSKICKKMSDSALLKSDLLKENEMYMAAKHLAGEFRSSFERQEKRAIVLLLGKTGGGKSSVANKIFGAEIAKVGRGKPVTKHFSRNTMPGKPVIVYDSKGFEIDCAKQFKEEMETYFSSCDDNVHVIWYVVDGTSSRFEPFEHDFLLSSPLGVPVIVLINKADLCAPADVDALKTTIESADIPCVKGVVATTAASAIMVEKPPESCPECGSDDISVRKKRMKWCCNECGHLENLKELSVAHEGLAQVVNLTHRIVPDIVKESFVAGQRVSIRTKLKGSRELIREFFKNRSESNNQSVIDIMARICTLWDLSEPRSNTTNLCDSSDSVVSASDIDDDSTKGSSEKSDGNASTQKTKRRETINLSFVENLILATENRKQALHERDDKRIDFDPYAYHNRSHDRKSRSIAEYESDSESIDEESGVSSAYDDEDYDEDEVVANGDSDDDDDNNVLCLNVMENVAHVIESRDLGLSNNESSSSLSKVSKDGNKFVLIRSDDTSYPSSASSNTNDFVHNVVSVTICWTQSLMALHLLLVDHGYDAESTDKFNPKKYNSILHGCANRAFAYFTSERIDHVKEMLNIQDTDTVFDETTRKVLRGIQNKLKNKKYNIEYILSSEEKVTQPYSVAYDSKFSSSSYPGELH